jgi:CheY-like chemotaxis protein
MSRKNLRVFLVEDEVIIRMMVADTLEELGHAVAAGAGQLNQALELAQSSEFDLAILDVNLNGKVITPEADLIKPAVCRLCLLPATGPRVCPKYSGIVQLFRSPSSSTLWRQR